MQIDNVQRKAKATDKNIPFAIAGKKVKDLGLYLLKMMKQNKINSPQSYCSPLSTQQVFDHYCNPSILLDIGNTEMNKTKSLPSESSSKHEKQKHSLKM